MADRTIEQYLQVGRLRRDDNLQPIRLMRGMAEGYPTGEYSIVGLRLDDLTRLADWLITLPAELYDPVADLHRALERSLLDGRRL